MSGRALTLYRGARLFYEGDLVEVVELAGTSTLLRNDRTSQFITVQLSRLVAQASSASAEPATEDDLSAAMAWSGLTKEQRAAVLPGRACTRGADGLPGGVTQMGRYQGSHAANMTPASH